MSQSLKEKFESFIESVRDLAKACPVDENIRNLVDLSSDELIAQIVEEPSED